MYAVTFFALEPDGTEIMVTVHWANDSVLGAYADDPTSTLAAIRMVERSPRIDGFRIEDSGGRLILKHVEVSRP